MAGRWLLAVTLVLAVVIGAALVFGVATSRTPGAAAELQDLRHERVIYLEDEHAFVVYNGGHPLALSDDPQHLSGEHVEWCETSQMFEGVHGETFDRRGYYYGGPARRGLDRYPVRIDGEAVYVDLDSIISGPERDTKRPIGPQGARCNA